MPNVRERSAPCGTIGACDCCQPWGFGAAFLSIEPCSLETLLHATEHYWSADTWARVLSRLVRLGVLELQHEGGELRFAMRARYAEPLQSLGDHNIYEWLDANFLEWRGGPDGPGWT